MRNRPLRAPGILLTPVEPADGPELWRVVDASRSHLQPWLPWVPFNTSASASQRYAEACSADWDRGRALRFGIRAEDTRELLGIVGLDNCVHIHRNCDLGYWLRADATGLGIMTKAANACLDFGFGRVGLRRVRCAAATGNAPSLGVIQRLGFIREGLARQAEYVDERWVDHAVFSLLDTDPRPSRDAD